MAFYIDLPGPANPRGLVTVFNRSHLQVGGLEEGSLRTLPIRPALCSLWDGSLTRDYPLSYYLSVTLRPRDLVFEGVGKDLKI